MTRQEMEIAAVDLLREGRRPEAADLIATFEASQDCQRGLATPWHDPHYRDRFAADLEMVAEAWPAILGEQPADVVASIRLLALIGSAFGDESAGRRLGIAAPRVGHLDADAAARMVVFHVGHLTNVASWRAAHVTAAEISSALDCCAACDRLQRLYRISALPTLPHAAAPMRKGAAASLCQSFRQVHHQQERQLRAS